ncbi:hypothetical protein BCR37DRAFT_382413 [Protomyces lactucae-debilis]|uniref:NAD(P)-binding domain-containing protein n=1 Tax=Protomyces lactucae-debilis TaxID=2754530 RepID=A0A1Y2F394_PROLT|nr:uncharacterized protein BCR37DRAFT_382413 [Protomyces lactucae-debilis]ORY78157.1 hypothetical protein BCR37DRAFT_382413 [Protomyces lactucae-debilis]
MTVDLLILGAGWTSTFLIPLCKERNISFAATTTTGHDGTIAFKFDDQAADSSAYKHLPEAKHVLITFPIKGHGGSKKLVQFYQETHKTKPKYIQLGSTGIWQSAATRPGHTAADSTSAAQPTQTTWISRHSPYDTTDPRAIAEDELKQLGGCILNLSGLWGGSRQPRTFVDRIVKSKADAKEKKSLHMVHGQDVARAILAVMGAWPGPSRWMLTDGFVYDWWALMLGWGSSSAAAKAETDGDAHGEVLTWILELMQETGTKALPRSMETLGRCYDAIEFWQTFKITPVRARI